MRVHWARLQAERLVQELVTSRKLDCPPVDPHKVAKLVGLHVISDDLGPDVSGLLIRKGEQVLIAVERSDPPNRRNFTIAHEIGHHMLGHQFESGAHVHVDKGNYISQRGPKSSKGVDPKEVEANQFAAALLMPSTHVRGEVHKLGRALLDSDVTMLAALFKVSEQAMTIRLSSLRLL
ncbi:MAG TPA: ImmA/IrrE family metallo-endopeptidase [Vicinamibacterales bacterium]|nr:ImmA/IrrE family metallo-endopeptidase [Vicinamibacterales bacterium]